MWLSANIILQKSFITHGAHVDKTFFLLALFWLMTAAGQAWTRRGRRHAGGRRTESLTRNNAAVIRRRAGRDLVS